MNWQQKNRTVTQSAVYIYVAIYFASIKWISVAENVATINME